MGSEDLVEERTLSTAAQALHRFRPGHAETLEDEACHQGRSVEAHSAVREHPVSRPDEAGGQVGDGVELHEVRELFVVDGKVDVENLIGDRRDAVIQSALEIDDRVDSALLERLPITEDGRDEERAGVVDLEELNPHENPHDLLAVADCF